MLYTAHDKYSSTRLGDHTPNLDNTLAQKLNHNVHDIREHSTVSTISIHHITSTIGTGTQEWHECPICVTQICTAKTQQKLSAWQ